MKSIRRVAAALASAVILLTIATSAAHAARGPYLDIVAYGAQDVTVIDVGNAGDAPLTRCTVTVLDDWNTLHTTVARAVRLAPGQYRTFQLVGVPRGYYVAVVECAEDRYGVPFTTRTPPFIDVPPAAIFHDPIMWLTAEEISTGWPDGTFRPQEGINRNAMAAFLYRMAGSPPVTPPAASPFTDLTPASPFYKEICWLASTGITRGYDDGTFRPLQKVNRDAMAAFPYRFFYDHLFPGRFPTYPQPATAPFPDVVGSPFVREIAWLKEYEITTGHPDGTYQPLSPVSREAMAAFLFRERLLIVANTPVEPAASPAVLHRVAADEPLANHGSRS